MYRDGAVEQLRGAKSAAVDEQPAPEQCHEENLTI